MIEHTTTTTTYNKHVAEVISKQCAYCIQAGTYVRTYLLSIQKYVRIQRDTSLLMAFLATAHYLQCKHIRNLCVQTLIGVKR